jgi:hypothetical protein
MFRQVTPPVAPMNSEYNRLYEALIEDLPRQINSRVDSDAWVLNFGERWVSL